MKKALMFGNAMAALSLQIGDALRDAIPRGPGHGTGKTRSPANARADKLVMRRRAYWGSTLPEAHTAISRQLLRAEERADAKKMRHLRKARAMQMKTPGGAAAIF